MMKALKEFIIKRRLKAKERRELEIKRQFEVVECGNTLWLVHDDVAFCEIPAGKTASEVSELLHAAREAAITYDAI